MYLSETPEATIKSIGIYCDLKKQTMTSHLNELETRGYIHRKPGLKDRREMIVTLTEYGEKFKFAMHECIKELEADYFKQMGNVELDRIQLILEKLYTEVRKEKQQDLL